jgi:ABC-type bacteriocin/lantibiotic exporter with double-glycine peptidase domain
MISIVLLKTVFQIIFSYNQEKISYKITKRINVTLYEKFINSKYIEYINEKLPRVIRVLNNESVRIGNQLISPFITMINEVFLLIFIISFIFFYDLVLGIAFSLMSTILLLSFNLSINKIIKGLGKKLTETNTSRIKLINETFKAFDVIKLFNKNQIFKFQFEKMTQNVSDAAFKNLFYLKLPKSIFELSIFIIVFGMIIIFSSTKNEALLISYLSVSAVSIYKIIPSLNKLSNAFQGIQYFSTPLKEIVGFLKINQESNPINTIKKFNRISYKNHSFKYETDMVLENINFEIIKNDFIGICGPSGSGKSTFIKLISGLMSSKKGEIFMDSEKINFIELRNYFSYVPQESIILDEDVFSNISLEFQDSKIDKNKVIDILKKVNLFEKFKDNLYSSLGESGIKISGGQKQRIAIARALYHNKSVLILDESTSNLDVITESRIIDLLKKLSSEISVIIVSHKTSSLEKCNIVYEINNKKIYRKT